MPIAPVVMSWCCISSASHLPAAKPAAPYRWAPGASRGSIMNRNDSSRQSECNPRSRPAAKSCDRLPKLAVELLQVCPHFAEITDRLKGRQGHHVDFAMSQFGPGFGHGFCSRRLHRPALVRYATRSGLLVRKPGDGSSFSTPNRRRIQVAVQTSQPESTRASATPQTRRAASPSVSSQWVVVRRSQANCIAAAACGSVWPKSGRKTAKSGQASEKLTASARQSKLSLPPRPS